jgi:peptide/nickel transport system permease protein
VRSVARRHPVVAVLSWRLLLGLVTLWIVSVLVFAAPQALPGDAALVKLTRNQTPEALAALRSQFHLDESLLTQYWLWLKGMLTGDLGTSFSSDLAVGTLVGDRLANTVWLVLLSALFAFPLGVAVGVWSAVRRDRFVDHASTVVLLTLAAIPEFVLGIGLILLLATSVFTVLPAVSALDPAQSVLAQLDLVLLPALTLALAIAAYLARMVRVSMVEVLESDYVAMARLKGLRERRVIVKHALINGSGATIQVSAIALAYLASGVVVVEAVFGFPGLGSALVSAVQSRDVPVIQAITLLIGAAYVVVNIAADVLTVLVTPKLRTAGAR